jgi:hypothetical protein
VGFLIFRPKFRVDRKRHLNHGVTMGVAHVMHFYAQEKSFKIKVLQKIDYFITNNDMCKY